LDSSTRENLKVRNNLDPFGIDAKVVSKFRWGVRV